MKANTRGFTLIEILIAVAITATIAVSAFAILNQALSTQQSAENLDQRLSQFQRTMNRLSMDLQQLALRRVRNAYGDPLPVLAGDKNAEESFLSLTRQGKRNPANLPRSEMERVTYKLSDKTLIREQWLVLDLALEDQVVGRELIDGVKRFEVAFFFDDEWLDSWPAGDISGNSAAYYEVPQAVKVTIEFEDLGEVIQIYPLGIEP
jgi:general secretion pathway protein J